MTEEPWTGSDDQMYRLHRELCTETRIKPGDRLIDISQGDYTELVDWEIDQGTGELILRLYGG